jgi:hypothetical protein
MDERQLTEAEARALWERAARLQAEAAARDLSASSDETDGSPPSRRTGDYSLEVVRRAAEEAGIAPEFVDRALEEAALGAEPPKAVDRWADRFLGDGPRILRVSGEIDGSIEAVYAALQRVLPNPPHSFSLVRTVGRAPLEGGTLVFEIPYYAGAGLGVGPSSQVVLDLRHYADIKEVNIRLRPVADTDPERPRTEIHIWATTANARRINFWVGNSIAAGVGVAAGVVGAALTGGLLAVGGAVAAAVGGVSGAAGFVGVRRGWRPLFRATQRRGERGMQRLVEAIRLNVHTGGGFTPSPDSRSLRGDGLSGMLEDLGL